MKTIQIALLLLLNSGYITFGQEKHATDPAEIYTANAEKGLIKVSIMYPYAEGKTFDMEYYETSHMPMVAGYLGTNLIKYTIEKGIGNGIHDEPLPYMAIGSFYVKSLSDYQAAIGPNIDAIRADIPKYTNISPAILVSEVIR